MPPTYWTAVFTVETWRETEAAGLAVVGFPANRWTAANRIHTGDVLICYLVGRAAFVGALEVTGPAYQAERPQIWSGATYPVRIPVRRITSVELERAVSVYEFLEELGFSTYALKTRQGWGAYFRSPPIRLAERGAEHVIAALLQRDPSRATV